MKSSDNGTPSSVATSVYRRKILTAAVIGAGLSMIPGAQALAASLDTSKLAPGVGMGYLAPAASSIVDAWSVPPARGDYALSVVGAGTKVPLQLAAQYGAFAEHYFWRAWVEQGMLQKSSPITIRWAAHAGNPLLLNITYGAGVVSAQVTAQPGIYVLTLVPAQQAPLPWSSLDVAKQYSGGVSRKLVSRSSGSETDLTYAIFSVQRV